MTKQYRVPAVISIEFARAAATDEILAALELSGWKTDPSTIRIIDDWDSEDGVWRAMYEVDIVGSEGVMSILMGNLIDINRPTGMVVTQVEYA